MPTSSTQLLARLRARAEKLEMQREAVARDLAAAERAQRARAAKRDRAAETRCLILLGRLAVAHAARSGRGDELAASLAAFASRAADQSARDQLPALLAAAGRGGGA